MDDIMVTILNGSTLTKETYTDASFDITLSVVGVALKRISTGEIYFFPWPRVAQITFKDEAIARVYSIAGLPR